MKKLKFLALLPFLCLVLNSAQACKCKEHPALNKENCELYHTILEGKADSITVCKDGYSTAWFSVINLFKGESYASVSIRFDCSSDCQMNISKGDTWILYGQYFKYGQLCIDFCSRTRKLIKEGDDFYTALNAMSYQEELTKLETIFGKRKISQKPKTEGTERILIQPTAWWKLWLLLISVVVMFVINFLVKKMK